MTTNLEQLKSISRTALINEIIEKTEHSALIWNETGPGQFMAEKGQYEFHLNKTNGLITSLDVMKNNQYYRSYNSSIQNGIDILFDTVTNLSSVSPIDKMRKLQKFVSKLSKCGDPDVISISSNKKGLKASGSGINAHIRPYNAILNPNKFVSEVWSHPWNGVYTSVDEGVSSHDGDFSKIVQYIFGGTGDREWPAAIFEFPLNTLPEVGQFKIVARFVLKTDVSISNVSDLNQRLDRVRVKTNVIINQSTIKLEDNMTVYDNYHVYTNPIWIVPASVRRIENLQLAIQMRTNFQTTDVNPYADFSLTAVDVQVFGYNNV